jgi:hypothetical protein
MLEEKTILIDASTEKTGHRLRRNGEEWMVPLFIFIIA